MKSNDIQLQADIRIKLPYSFRYRSRAFDGKKHLLLAASGNVATINLPKIVLALAKQKGLSIRLALTG